VAALLATAAATFDPPARQALIPALVPRARLAEAIALLNPSRELAILVGPASGGSRGRSALGDTLVGSLVGSLASAIGPVAALPLGELVPVVASGIAGSPGRRSVSLHWPAPTADARRKSRGMSRTRARLRP